MKFNYETPVKRRSRVKATIQKNGRLGFSSGAAQVMQLDVNMHYKVATNAEDDEDDCLYLISANEDDDKVFKANKAGEYYYLNLKYMFDRKGIDYEHEKVIYDITEEVDNELRYYKLKRRTPITRN